jgi:hypothetical protein
MLLVFALGFRKPVLGVYFVKITDTKSLSCFVSGCNKKE